MYEMPTGNSQRDECLGNDFSAKMTDLILSISLARQIPNTSAFRFTAYLEHDIHI